MIDDYIEIHSIHGFGATRKFQSSMYYVMYNLRLRLRDFVSICGNGHRTDRLDWNKSTARSWPKIHPKNFLDALIFLSITD